MRDKKREYSRRYYSKHREQIKAYSRARYRLTRITISDPRFNIIFNRIWRQVKNGR